MRSTASPGEQDVLAQDPPAGVQDDVVLALLEADVGDGPDLSVARLHVEAGQPVVVIEARRLEGGVKEEHVAHGDLPHVGWIEGRP
jgi:hypothetical protein